MVRAAWIKERRRAADERMDTLWAPVYDEQWGAIIEPTHQRMVERFLELCPPHAHILDAACGTGKYWPLILERGHSILGIDQSEGMLRRAQAKFPHVLVEKVGLQELAYEWMFDGIICVDAMELVVPEDWPGALANFHRALRSAGQLYLTVELPEPGLPEVFEAAVAAGLPVVRGEYFKAGGYHYYPAIVQARAWIVEAGFDILEEVVGDDYHHFLARIG